MNDLLITIITIIVTIFISNYIFYNMMMNKINNIVKKHSILTQLNNVLINKN
jgi:uncharacterized protein YxeA